MSLAACLSRSARLIHFTATLLMLTGLAGVSLRVVVYTQTHKSKSNKKNVNCYQFKMSKSEMNTSCSEIPAAPCVTLYDHEQRIYDTDPHINVSFIIKDVL